MSRHHRSVQRYCVPATPRVLAIMVFSSLISSVCAIQYFVAPDGDDTRNGLSTSNAFLTISKAAANARAGDTVNVLAGTYRERVAIKNSGRPDAPIVFQGEAGAIVDAGDVISGWEPAPEVGSNVFRNTRFPYIPMNMTWSNKYVLGIRYWDKANDRLFDFLNNGIKAADHYCGPSDTNAYYGWAGIEALFGTKIMAGAGASNGTTYVRFRNNNDPNREPLTFAPAGASGFTVDNRGHVVIRNFTVRNGYHAILLANQASNCIIERNTLIGGQYTVYLTGGAKGNHIRDNAITLNYVHSMGWRKARPFWFIWEAFKYWSSYDRIAVGLFKAGNDNEIYRNYIFEHWGGIQDWVPDSWRFKKQTEATRAEYRGYCQNLKVYNNFIEDCHDDGLEPDGAEVNARWFGNIVRYCNVNFRIKYVSTGPLYIYNNCLYNGAGQKPADSENLAFYVPGATDAKIYVYHNSIAGGQAILINWMPITNLPNTVFVNNIFSTSKFSDSFKPGARWMSPEYQNTRAAFDYNWYGGDVQRTPFTGEHDIIAAGSYLWDPGAMPDFSLPTNSPVIAKGLDLSREWTVRGTAHPPLPGMNPGYFKRARPDLGALQSGQTTNDLNDLNRLSSEK